MKIERLGGTVVYEDDVGTIRLPRPATAEVGGRTAREMKPPRFRTWIEGEPPRKVGPLRRLEPYDHISDVPLPVIQKMRELHRHWGVPAPEIADLLQIPCEWVERFLNMQPSEGDDR